MGNFVTDVNHNWSGILFYHISKPMHKNKANAAFSLDDDIILEHASKINN